MSMGILLAFIALLIAIEGLFIASFPRKIARLMKDFVRDLKRLRWFGVIEFLIGMILLVIAVIGRNS